MSELDLEAAIDELYSADLPDFTARRNELAKELRGEGRRAAADQVKDLRKPTLAAWAVNQLARRNRREVDLLLDAGHRAREAQRGLLSGKDRSGLEDSLQTERRALQELHAAARSILRERGSEPQPALLEKISQTLRAAAVNDEGREALARGRLTEELAPAGFDAFAGLTPVRKPKAEKSAEKRPERSKRPEPPKRTDVAEARERLAAARTRVRGLERRLKETESAATDLRKQLERADRGIEELQAEVEGAQAEADDAQRALDRARRR